MGLLYAIENFTHFDLVNNENGQSKLIEESWIDETLDVKIELRCPKCRRQVTSEEYQGGKLRPTPDSRQVNRGKWGMLTKLSGEDMVRFRFEHKRCPK